MGRIDTLVNCFTDICDVIRDKTGKTDKIKVSDITTEILNLPAGGAETPKVGFTIDEWDSQGYATKITVYGMTSLPSNAFCKYSKTSYKSGAMVLDKIKEVVLPNTLQSIGTGAFSNLVLEKINIPNNVTSIGNSAFSYCSELSINELSDNVTSIGQSAFIGNSKMAISKLPANLTSLGSQAFRNCTNLAIKTIPDGITKLADWVFGGNESIRQLSMKNVTSIDYRTLSGCLNLYAVWIGSAITTTSASLFSTSNVLKKIYIDLPRTTVETLTGYAEAFSGNAISTDKIICNDDADFITKEQFDAIDWATYTE